VKADSASGLDRPAVWCAEITDQGIEHAERGAEREGARRQLRILRHMRHESGDTPSRIALESIATAFQIPLVHVGNDVALLKEQGLVTTQATADNTPWPQTAILTPRGFQVADEGWSDHARASGTHQSIHFGDNARNVVVGQAGHDSLIKHIQQPGDHAELLQVLADLRRALEQATSLPDDKRDDGLDAVDRIAEELDREQPRRRSLESALRALSVVADVAGTAQGAAMVSELVGKLTPHVNQVCQALT